MKNDCLKNISSKIFNDFDEAYCTLKASLKEIGLTKSGVFDGCGNIKEMYKYFKGTEKECHDEAWWADDFMIPIKYISDLVLDKETKIKPFAESDGMITWKYRRQVF